MSMIAKLVRRQVSIDKRRYTFDGYDLDLTYITDRIIAMGFPADGVESIYRNPIDDVASLLLEKHGEHFMIFNLSERSYDYAKFNNQVIDFGFPDHHSPSFPLLLIICKSIHSHLLSDPRNVVVVHCMAGKGRTGTTIASYMMYSGLFIDADEALDHFGRQRSMQSIGVTVPSQVRYVNYMHSVCRGLIPNPNPFVMRKIIMNGVPHFHSTNGCRPFLEVYLCDELIYSSAPREQDILELPLIPPTESHIIFDINKIVRGDIYVRFYHGSRGKGVYMFRFQIHTGFLPIEAPLHRFPKSELDDAQKDKRFDEDFFIDIMFKTLDSEEVDEAMIDKFDWSSATDQSLRGRTCYNMGYLSAADLSAESMADEVKSDVLSLSWKVQNTAYSTKVDDSILFLVNAKEYVYGGCADGTVVRWNFHNGNLDKFPGHGPSALIVCPLGDSVIAAYADGKIKSWNIWNSSVSWEFVAHKEGITCAKYYRHVLYTSSLDGSIRGWDLHRNGSSTLLADISSSVVDFSVDDNNILVTTSGHSFIHYNLDAKEVTRVYECHVRTPKDLFIAEDLGYVAERCMVSVFKFQTGEILRALNYDSPVLSFLVYKSVIVTQLADRLVVTEIRKGTDTSSLFIKAEHFHLHGNTLTVHHDSRIDIIDLQQQLRTHIPRRAKRESAEVRKK